MDALSDVRPRGRCRNAKPPRRAGQGIDGLGGSGAFAQLEHGRPARRELRPAVPRGEAAAQPALGREEAPEVLGPHQALATGGRCRRQELGVDPIEVHVLREARLAGPQQCPGHVEVGDQRLVEDGVERALAGAEPELVGDPVAYRRPEDRPAVAGIEGELGWEREHALDHVDVDEWVTGGQPNERGPPADVVERDRRSHAARRRGDEVRPPPGTVELLPLSGGVGVEEGGLQLGPQPRRGVPIGASEVAYRAVERRRHRPLHPELPHERPDVRTRHGRGATGDAPPEVERRPHPSVPETVGEQIRREPEELVAALAVEEHRHPVPGRPAEEWEPEEEVGRRRGQAPVLEVLERAGYHAPGVHDDPRAGEAESVAGEADELTFVDARVVGKRRRIRSRRPLLGLEARGRSRHARRVEPAAQQDAGHGSVRTPSLHRSPQGRPKLLRALRGRGVDRLGEAGVPVAPGGGPISAGAEEGALLEPLHAGEHRPILRLSAEREPVGERLRVGPGFGGEQREQVPDLGCERQPSLALVPHDAEAAKLIAHEHQLVQVAVVDHEDEVAAQAVQCAVDISADLTREDGAELAWRDRGRTGVDRPVQEAERGARRLARAHPREDERRIRVHAPTLVVDGSPYRRLGVASVTSAAVEDPRETGRGHSSVSHANSDSSGGNSACPSSSTQACAANLSPGRTPRTNTVSMPRRARTPVVTRARMRQRSSSGRKRSVRLTTPAYHWPRSSDDPGLDARGDSERSARSASGRLVRCVHRRAWTYVPTTSPTSRTFVVAAVLVVDALIRGWTRT